MNSHNLTSRALIGAIIGGGLVCLLVIISIEVRFMLEGLMVLGSGGIIGGAVCGIILGGPAKRIGVVIGGLVGGIAGCALLAFATLLYTATPWPSPQPYPGAQATITEGAVGSWGLGRTQTYRIDQPADTIQTYYEFEMAKSCVQRGQFIPLSNDDYVTGNWWSLGDLPIYAESNRCREANCSISRFRMEQDFRVLICEDAATRSTVVQVDAWED